MKSRVYKNLESKKAMLSLYDTQMSSLNIGYEDLVVNTRFGDTHVVRLGNPDGDPIVLFHGGNSTTPFSLKDFLFLSNDYLLFAPDTIGHPGKSAETVLSAKNMEYGQWAMDVITALKIRSTICIGSSYGGGILMKLMCVAPQLIKKAVLIVPAGICNTSTISIMIKLGIPMLMYLLTKSEKWLVKSILPMEVKKEEIDKESMIMVRSSFENVKVKSGMPGNVKKNDLKQYKSPTLIIAGEKDVIFPGKKVIKRGKRIIANLETYILSGRGHMNQMRSKRNEDIVTKVLAFLQK